MIDDEEPLPSCRQCYHEYLPPDDDDDGFCSDTCMKLYDEELMADGDPLQEE